MAKSPPLNGLRAFEFAARTGSFVEAGELMGVSSAAVSQHVRALEDFWGKKLFLRQGNRISLTEAGLSAYPALATAFEAIEGVSSTMEERGGSRRVVLSVPASLAETWLLGRMKNLRGLPLEIRIDEDPVSFAREGVDLRVFYGHELYREYRRDTLYRDRLIPVASPTFCAEFLADTDIEALDDKFFIHTTWGQSYASSPDWASWLSLFSSRSLRPGLGLRVGQSSLALRLAGQGIGVALVPEQMAVRELAAETVLRIGDRSQPMAHDYMLAWPHTLSRRKDVQKIVTALKT